jgi:hypothetical protein
MIVTGTAPSSSSLSVKSRPSAAATPRVRNVVALMNAPLSRSAACAASLTLTD